jgi:hypothetical protein
LYVDEQAALDEDLVVEPLDDDSLYLPLLPEDDTDADDSDLEEPDEEGSGDESPVYDASEVSSDSDVESDTATLGMLFTWHIIH